MILRSLSMPMPQSCNRFWNVFLFVCGGVQRWTSPRFSNIEALWTQATTHFYKEFEMNAFNTTWMLCLNKPYGDGGYEAWLFGRKKSWTGLQIQRSTSRERERERDTLTFTVRRIRRVFIRTTGGQCSLPFAVLPMWCLRMRLISPANRASTGQLR